MFRQLLRSTSFVLVAAAAATTAHADTTCAPPTQQQCQDSAFYQTDCGKLQSGPSSQCAALIKPLAQAAYDAIPATTTRQMINPLTGAAQATRVPAYVDTTRKADGNSAVYIGKILKTELATTTQLAAATASVATPATLSPASKAFLGANKMKNVFVLPLKQQWEANGATVGSCEEYAFEKHYDYSRWEDVATSLGTDYRAVFNLAFDAALGIANKALHTKSGAGMQLQIFWPFSSGSDCEFGGCSNKFPKNEFYKGYSWARSYGFQLNDANLEATLDGGQQYWGPQDWNWHQSMSTQLASVPDDELNQLDFKKEAFTRLVQKRIDGAYDGKAGLAALDAQIRTALQEAQTLGCLDNTKTTACDWSPRGFYKTMSGYYTKYREYDYQRCMSVTGNNFTFARSALGISGLYATKNDYTTKAEDMDEFFSKYTTYARNQPTMKDPATGKTVLGQSVGDSATLGNDKFGVTYGYEANWRVSGFEGTKQACEAKASTMGRLYADGTVFGSTYDLFEAKATADSDKTGTLLAADVFVGGSNIYHKDHKITPYHLDGSPSFTKKFEGAYHFVVLAIPVVVRGGITVSAGLQYSLDAAMAASCGANQSVTLAEVKGHAKPWIDADGFASAGVDLLIADAGVKLNLTLLKAELPFDGNVRVYMLPTSGGTQGTLYVDATATLKLRMSTLDGKLSLYIDSWFGDDEETLLSWDGFSVDENLFSVGRTGIPLLTVKSEIDTQNGLVNRWGGKIAAGGAFTAVSL